MPYYRITVTDVFGVVRQGIRYDFLTDIDAYYQKAHRKAVTALRNTLKSVDVVMLTTHCEDVKKYMEKQRNSMEYKPTEGGYQGKEKFAYRNLETDK